MKEAYGTIIPFPNKKPTVVETATQASMQEALFQNAHPIILAILGKCWMAIWMMTFWAWRLVRWPYIIFCVLQLVRMVIHWDTPGLHAGWTFLAYFAILVIGDHFVLLIRPKAFR